MAVAIVLADARYDRSASVARALASERPSDVPAKGVMDRALEGSSNWRLASRSPASMTDPADIRGETFPASAALSGMIIFIASTSANVSPFATDSPSSFNHRTILPVTSDLISEGSKAAGTKTVAPSTIIRRPSGSSNPVICRETPPTLASSVPSGCSRTLAGASSPPFVEIA